MDARNASLKLPPTRPVLPGGPALGRADDLARASACALLGVLFMGSTLLTPLYGLYRADLGFSKLVLVLLYAVYVVGNLAALLLFGRLSDQVGRKPAAFAGLALAAASSLIFLAARSEAALFAGRALSGFAVGLGAGAATAWIAELTPEAERARAASVTVAANFIGLAFGPVMAGVLVQYAPAPLRLPFIAYVALLAVIGLLVALSRETVATRQKLSLKPRLGVPAGRRVAFIAPAVTLFVAMALVGFYAALGPTVIREDLHISNLALSGVMVAELFVAATVAVLATRFLDCRPAMLIGLGLMPPAVALLALAQRQGSLGLLLVATALCGAASALGYRGSLQVINRLAPPDRRAEMVSAYFLTGFMGNALPVIGVGALSQRLGPHPAALAFAGLIAGLAVLAFGVGWKAIPAGE